ncbi:hypothetical protein BDV40DRAFT_296395 [Aspergillus tamarii]|uniref:Uncharacterized protein n=1 Tax=Aspergillus tamarii TaxID=41984 RepID=A0A5N6V6U1_ASPTM|nr:hypothetical protein BDV40DRAFT_296395 [Aspergillus tamarii]
MGLFDFFKSSKEESPRTQQPTWDPNTMTMQQPASPPAPMVDRTVSEQSENMHLRGGGAGDCCCGM